MQRLNGAMSRLASCQPYRWAVGILLATMLGCGAAPIIMEGNYLTYEHDFTDAAAQDVKKNAESLCRQRRQDALKVDSVCNLQKCFTHYQCVNPKDPLEYYPPDQG